jgi:hypothetical protein
MSQVTTSKKAFVDDPDLYFYFLCPLSTNPQHLLIGDLLQQMYFTGI